MDKADKNQEKAAEKPEKSQEKSAEKAHVKAAGGEGAPEKEKEIGRAHV
jgi:hypothetical protein